MSLADVMQEYFRGERQLGLGLAGLGLALGVAAVWVWRTQKGTFGSWLWVAGALLSLVLVSGGVALALRTGRQVADLTEQLERDSEAMVAAERARMASVNANWPRLKLGWGALTLVALVLLLVLHREWSTALGLTLMFVATTLFFVDVFAQRRAGVYTQALERAAYSP
jgi:hypothetical protein